MNTDTNQSLIELKEGKIPYSSIINLIYFAKKENKVSVSFPELIDYINDGNTQVGNDRCKLLEQLKDMKKIHADFSFDLDVLTKTGLQVEVEFYKESGKFAYSGIVSLGNVLPHLDKFSEKVLDSQKIINQEHTKSYNIVVRDTPLNYADHNYVLCVNRMIMQ